MAFHPADLAQPYSHDTGMASKRTGRSIQGLLRPRFRRLTSLLLSLSIGQSHKDSSDWVSGKMDFTFE